MAKNRMSKEDEEKAFQDKVQKRMENIFTGSGEPLTSLSMREVEALQAHVAELEAKLAEQKPDAAENTSSPTVANSDAQTPAPSISAEPEVARMKSIPTTVSSLPEISLSPSAQPPELEDFITLWRERLLTFILRGAAAVGFIAVADYSVNYFQQKNWASLATVIIVYGLLLAITFVKIPYQVKAYTLVSLMFFLYVRSMMQSGVGGDADVFMLIIVIISFMLLGLRPGIVIWVLMILAMFAVGFGVANHLLPLTYTFDQLDPEVWVSHGVITNVLSVVGITGIILLQNEFSLAQQRERKALNQVYAERSNLALRVQERTHDLELASEVGRTVTAKIHNMNEMLSTAVEMIRARFDLYYTQVYLTDPTGRSIILRAGTGDVGERLLQRGHHLLIDSGSLNGRAALQKKPIIVADTRQSANFLANALLQNTRSEMAIPLIVSDQVIGVLDMQSEQPGGLNENNLTAFEALAGQLAVAIQNASLFAQVEEARSEVEAHVTRITEKGWQGFLDAIEHGQKIGFSFDKTNVVSLTTDDLSTVPAEVFSTPITVIGTKIGQIQLLHEPDRVWTSREAEFTQSIAAQLGQHIDSLRLLAQTEKYRAEAEDAVRRLTREGWGSYQTTHSEETFGFVYDTNEVHPLSEKGIRTPTAGTVQPLTVQNEIVGELAIEAGNHLPEGTDEFMAAVGTQLSAHIENLRLSISNMNLLKSTEERAQREQNLRELTTALRSSTNPATIMRTAVRELGSILGRKTVIQMTTAEQAEAAASQETAGGTFSGASPISPVGGKR